MLGETEGKPGDSHRGPQVPCPDPAAEMWARCPVQQGMGQSLKERTTTGGPWAKNLQTHQHHLYPRHLWHGCLSEGVVALQDGLTHSGLTSQGKSDVSVRKEEEPQINVFRQ